MQSYESWCASIPGNENLKNAQRKGTQPYGEIALQSLKGEAGVRVCVNATGNTTHENKKGKLGTFVNTIGFGRWCTNPCRPSDPGAVSDGSGAQ